MNARPHYQSLITSAPGKLMLSGEYVVLDGVRALVAAVDVRARAYWMDALAEGTKVAPPEVRSTANMCRWRGFHPPTVDGMPLELDVVTTDFYEGGEKLGLGSSAASAAAAAAAHMLERFPLIGSALHDVFRAAHDGHKTSVGAHGSGADVAASVYGGFLEVIKTAGPYPEVRALAWPAGLKVSVVWSGSSARTSDALTTVAKVRKLEPARYADAAAPLTASAEIFARAFESAELGALLAATELHHEAMRSFGAGTGLDVVTGALGAIAALAKEHGGAAKPSGAGGGDCAIAFFDDAARKRAFDAACRTVGAHILPITLGAEGVRDDRIAEQG
jgi:phosphomevalonate kinase